MVRRILKIIGLGVLALLLTVVTTWWYLHPRVEVERNVGYGTRNESRLSYDVVTPMKQNGAAVLVVISGGWQSNAGPFQPWPAAIFLRRGYTVFAIRHLSQPRATVSEIVEDLNLAVRHIRHHAADYGIEKFRMGMVGASSGGHLSLMLATRGTALEGSSEVDSIDLESSAVQAAAVFFPVTDLVDLGPSTENPGDGGPPLSFVAGFGFTSKKSDRRRISETDMPEWKAMAHELSPLYHVGEDLPPVLIIHGDADTLVPLDQSQRFLARARELGLDDRIDLQIRKGKEHGWLTMVFELRHIANWFDQHLEPNP